MWKFNPFIGALDYFQGYDIVNHTASVVLTLGDMKRVHVMDVSGGLRTFWLPTIGTGNIGEWFIAVRNGTGNALRVWAGGTNKVLNSAAGGYVECNDAGHDYSSLLFVVVADGQWGNPSYGIWESH